MDGIHSYILLPSFRRARSDLTIKFHHIPYTYRILIVFPPITRHVITMCNLSRPIMVTLQINHNPIYIYSAQSTCSHQLFQPCNHFHHLHELHIVFKNVQSSFSDQRLLAFDIDLNALDFHICAIAETWTTNTDEHFATASGHDVYLSGGAPDGHKGVGFVICNKIRSQLTSIIFRSIHCRLCLLDFSLCNQKCRFICVDLPDSWTSSLDETQKHYAHMSFLIQEAKDDHRYACVCGDFNVSIGNVLRSEDEPFIVSFGIGPRAARGSLLTSFVQSEGM